MANPVPAGSDVSAGTYKCTDCGNELSVGSTNHLPPCPECGNGEYRHAQRRRQPRRSLSRTTEPRAVVPACDHSPAWRRARTCR